MQQSVVFYNKQEREMIDRFHFHAWLPSFTLNLVNYLNEDCGIIWIICDNCSYICWFLRPDMQKVATTQPLVAEICLDCWRTKARNYKLMTAEILQLISWFLVILLIILQIDRKIKDVSIQALLRKFLKIQILASEGF